MNDADIETSELRYYAERNKKLGAKIKAAVDKHDIGAVNSLVDNLRFNCALNYEQIAVYFKEFGGVSADDFEGLMQECDEFDSKGG